MRGLDLNGNPLRSLDPSLARLAELRALSLERTELAELPSWVGDLSQLEMLFVAKNPLTTLPASLATLERLATSVTISSDRAVMREASVGRECLVVVDGELEVERDGHPVATLGPGELVGEAALLTGRPRNATVRARAGSTVYALNRREFASMMETSEAFAEHVRRTDAARRAA